MRFKFDNPNEISRGTIPDQIKIDIAKPEYFRSKKSNEPLKFSSEQKDQFNVGVPRQLPEDVDEEALVSEATAASAQLGYFMVV